MREMIEIKSFSLEDEEIVFKDERGAEHKLSFDDIESLVEKLHQMRYIELEASLKFTRKFAP